MAESDFALRVQTESDAVYLIAQAMGWPTERLKPIVEQVCCELKDVPPERHLDYRLSRLRELLAEEGLPVGNEKTPDAETPGAEG